MDSLSCLSLNTSLTVCPLAKGGNVRERPWNDVRLLFRVHWRPLDPALPVCAWREIFRSELIFQLFLNNLFSFTIYFFHNLFSWGSKIYGTGRGSKPILFQFWISRLTIDFEIDISIDSNLFKFPRREQHTSSIVILSQVDWILYFGQSNY